MSLDGARQRPGRNDQGGSDDDWIADPEGLRELCELRELKARKKAGQAKSVKAGRWKEPWEQ